MSKRQERPDGRLSTVRETRKQSHIFISAAGKYEVWWVGVEHLIQSVDQLPIFFCFLADHQLFEAHIHTQEHQCWSPMIKTIYLPTLWNLLRAHGHEVQKEQVPKKSDWFTDEVVSAAEIIFGYFSTNDTWCHLCPAVIGGDSERGLLENIKLGFHFVKCATNTVKSNNTHFIY